MPGKKPSQRCSHYPSIKINKHFFFFKTEKLKQTKKSRNRFLLLHFLLFLSAGPSCSGPREAGWWRFAFRGERVGKQGGEFHFCAKDIGSVTCQYVETFILLNAES